jgi:DNA-binding transcriptional LysR family regulator
MNLEALRAFVKVAELGSFTRAAEQLGLPKPRVSTAVQQLEAQLGARLLQRTTRTVRMTADGEQFFQRAQALLADAEDMQTLFAHTPSVLRGRLRIDLPLPLARNFVIPRLPEFFLAHPQLELELSTTDRKVDVVHEGFDCVVRVGSLVDSGLVARKLGVLHQINCASPAYLKRYGVPRTLQDLQQHRLVHYAQTLGAASAPAGWEYVVDGRSQFVPMAGVITVNSTDAYQAACLAGLGLIQAPWVGAQTHLAAGHLVPVLPEFVGAPMTVSLLYPHRQHLSKRAQAVMAWLADVLAAALQAPASPVVAKAAARARTAGTAARARRATPDPAEPPL